MLQRNLLKGAVFALSTTLPAAVMAQDALPDAMTWTAYGTTTSGYAQSVAIGDILNKHYGTTIRVVPGKNDVSRMAPMRDGRAEYCACGAAVYFAQEGVFLFAANEWGPQPLRVVMTATGNSNNALAMANDVGIKTVADLKGKRVSYVQGGDALNWNVAAVLAFAGLGWDDVEKVVVSGYKASADAIINGQSDAAFMSTVTPHAQRIASSSRGLMWAPLPHDDTEGWKRLNGVSPLVSPHIGTAGANLSAETPHEGGTYPYPALVTMAGQSENEVYDLTKALVEHFDEYKDAAPGAGGWALENQQMEWALPFHDGAVRYWKEIGVWTDEHQAHQDMLVKRQNTLIEAWANLPNRAELSPEELVAAWQTARADALTSVGLPAIFDTVKFD